MIPEVVSSHFLLYMLGDDVNLVSHLGYQLSLFLKYHSFQVRYFAPPPLTHTKFSRMDSNYH